jgi:succinoglycan biosynthesis protein ExoM
MRGSSAIATSAPEISVCLATFRRNERLRAVLDDLAQQTLKPRQVVVVDNDPSAGARSVVEAYRASGVPFPVDYDVQPEPNIALTRNRSVHLAVCEWLAFIDDDERAPKEWLAQLMQAAATYHADAVLAPVEPQVPADAPRWIRRGRFYDFPHQPEGAEVPLNCMRFGNILIHGVRLRAEPGPFDPSHELMAGEDADLLVRMVHNGAKVIWTEKAPVYEPVEPKRLSLKFLALRALGGGQGFARYALGGGYQPMGFTDRCSFLLKALLQFATAAILSVATFPFGRHHAAAWFIKACANYGKVSTLWGGRYHAYNRGTEAPNSSSFAA